MSLLRFFSTFRAAGRTQGVPPQGQQGFESAESALTREFARADRENPDWDLNSRVATAAGALERGIPEHLVRQVYGETVFAKAAAGRAEKATVVHFSRSTAERT